jgi:hypothetical protein
MKDDSNYWTCNIKAKQLSLHLTRQSIVKENYLQPLEKVKEEL